jgi:hypothetical protein
MLKQDTFERITRARIESSENTWLRQPRSIKNEQVFATCNRTEGILRERRLPCAWIASQLAMLGTCEELRRQRSRLQIRLAGPQQLTGLIEAWPLTCPCSNGPRVGGEPRKLGKLNNHDQEPWKLPLPAFIQSLYQKRFGKDRPDVVHSIEERVRLLEQKKAARRDGKRLRREAAP